MSDNPNPDPSGTTEGESTDQIDLSPIAKQILRTKSEDKRACFIIHGGLDIGSVIPIDDRVVVLGRGSKCTVTLRDDGISRYHAEVIRSGTSKVMIRDLNSTNGTFVGGERITEAVLKDGDKVLLGRRTVLKFVLQDELDEDYHQGMYESSTRDALTGIYNRKYLIEKMIADLSYARRHRIPFTLVIFDLDHFKRVNDTYGHQIGDQVLVMVSNAVAEMIRAEDVLGRYGGEEFAVIAQGTDYEGAKKLGERLRECVENLPALPVQGDKAAGRVTISVGVSTVQMGASVDVSKMIAEADNNLYRAKRAGRNKVISSEIKQVERIAEG